MSFRIFIADDESLIRQDMVELLGGLGYLVAGEAADGQAALDGIRRLRPDVVILDIKMPEIDGLEVARQVGDEYPVIILTAYASSDFIRRARDAGVMAYLTKPFREQDIAPAVELAVTHFLREAKLTERVKELSEGLATRRLVDRAKGVLMDRMQVSESAAYRQIQSLSMDRNLPMRDVAQAIISGDG